MKKELSVFFILLILSTAIPFVLSVDDSEEPLSGQTGLSRDFGSIVEGVEVENVFKREVEVPVVIRFILGLRGGSTFTWEKLILTIGSWVIFFIIIHATISIVPFFIGNEKIQLGVSFVVLMLISMTTGVTYVVDLFVNIFDAVTFLDKLGPAKIFLSILLLVVGIKGASIISSRIKEKVKMTKAADAGQNLNFASKIGKVESDNI